MIDHISKKLGIGKGETTEDGEFTLMGAECLGSCGTAPMMQVNDHYYENLSLQDVDELLEKLRGTEDQEPAVADLAMGPGSGPSRALPREGERLEAGRAVHVPHFGETETVTGQVAARPKDKAGEVETDGYTPLGMAQ